MKDRPKIVTDVAGLRSLVFHNHLDLAFIFGSDVNYKFEGASSDADDGDATLRPDNVEVGDPGRWKKVGGSAPVLIASGTYTGAGGSVPIVTGLTGAIKAVVIYCSPAAGNGQGVYYANSAMTAGDWRDSSGNTGIGLTLAGSDFTVTPGTGDGPNQIGVQYSWTAWGS